MTRPRWPEYFINIAEQVATRSTCPRASVGAVLVKDNRILATGYNGSPSGTVHCFNDGGEPLCILNEQGRNCKRVIHAEMNAIAHAAAHGVSINGAVMYFWDSRDRSALDCDICPLLMIASGIKYVIGRNLLPLDLDRYFHLPNPILGPNRPTKDELNG